MAVNYTEIHIHGAMSILKGSYPKGMVRQVTSYPVEGAEFSKSYRKGLWDGRKHLFNIRTGAFPTGLVKSVKSTCEQAGYTVLIMDHRREPSPEGRSFDLVGATMEGKYDYQLEACKTMVAEKQGIVKAATNSGKTEIACAVTKYLGLKTLFVVNSVELMYQARDRFQKRLGLTDVEVGIVGAGKWNPGELVTIAVVHTLDSRSNTKECQKLLKETKVLFLDECHHTGSESVYKVTTMCDAYYRFGLSGTPLSRTDGANLRLIAATGEIIVNISNKFLVERGISAKANIVFDTVTEPVIKGKAKYPAVYKQGVTENPHLLNKVVEWTKLFKQQGLSVLILIEEIAHGKTLDDMLWTHTDGEFIPHTFIHGSESTEARQKALQDFDSRSLPVLIASSILDEGISVNSIDALILAGSRKSKIRTLQRLGRGLRGQKLIVVEFANYCHKYLVEHSMTRLADYKAEDCFDIFMSGPSAELIDKLWNGTNT